MPVTFLHTADWQLGMTRHFLDADAQARFTQDRLDAIRRIAALADERRAEFVVVAGDVFETNHLDRRTVVRAVEAMNAFNVPLYLLPGNHDPLCPGSVWTSDAYTGHAGPNLHVITASAPQRVRNGVEVVGAPWLSKRPLGDLVAAATAGLNPAPAGTLRIAVAHGGVDKLAPDDANPALIRMSAATEALRTQRLHYLALGDRHSVTRVDDAGRTWYAGAPEATDFVEDRPGFVLAVTLDDAGEATVEEIPVGRWRFVSRTDIPLDTPDDLDAFRDWLDAPPDKSTTVLRLAFTGTLNLEGRARLDELLAHARDVFAAVDTWARHDRLAVLPDESELSGMQLSGFARTACDRLANEAAGDGPEAGVARDALALLYRLSAGS